MSILFNLREWIDSCLSELQKEWKSFKILKSEDIVNIEINAVENPKYHRTTKSSWIGGPVQLVTTKTVSSNDLDPSIRDYISSQKKVGDGCVNIVKFFGIVLPSPRSPRMLPEVVLEYHHNGTLYDYLNTFQTEIPLIKRLNLIEDILRGLMYIHERLVWHYALHDKNIYINKHGRAMISDFGVPSIDGDGNYDPSHLPSIFVPPEYLIIQEPQQRIPTNERYKKKKGRNVLLLPKLKLYQYDDKSDIYSYGVLFWRIMTQTLSYEVKDLFKPQIDQRSYEELRRICCYENPTKRPTANEVFAKLQALRNSDRSNRVDFRTFTTLPNLNIYEHNFLSQALCTITSRYENVQARAPISPNDCSQPYAYGIKLECTLSDIREKFHATPNTSLVFKMLLSPDIKHYKYFSDTLQTGTTLSIKDLLIQPSPGGPNRIPELIITSVTTIIVVKSSDHTPKRQNIELHNTNLQQQSPTDRRQDKTPPIQESNVKRSRWDQLPYSSENIEPQFVFASQEAKNVFKNVSISMKRCIDVIETSGDFHTVVDTCIKTVQCISNEIYSFGLKTDRHNKKRKLNNTNE